MISQARLKTLIAPLRAAMAEFSEPGVKAALTDLFRPDASVRLCHPFGDLIGPEALYEAAYAPLFAALPDLERRDFIVVVGTDAGRGQWIGCAGYYLGTFSAPFLDIPPTGHLAHIRFHEFYRVENERIAEMQAIWDIPELMMQAGAWPMAPSLAREICVPGPATQDGLSEAPRDPAESQASLDLVINMLTHLSRHPAEGGPVVMQSERFWHERMNWYGPAGIGTARGFSAFRNWHQIPFLNAMPDRKGGTSGTLTSHFFAEGSYVAVTGWPNMQMTVTGDGWMGIAPAGQSLTMRSLDFWRIQDDRIRENWVLVDILDVYRQLGVDVFARLREFNKARNLGSIRIIDRTCA